MNTNQTKKMRKKYKITDRRKFARFIVCCVLMIASLTTFVLGLTVSEASSDMETVFVTVQRGDSLWSLAKTYGPENADPRVVIYNIQQLNQLDSADIYPGDVLEIPTSL